MIIITYYCIECGHRERYSLDRVAEATGACPNDKKKMIVVSASMQ